MQRDVSNQGEKINDNISSKFKNKRQRSQNSNDEHAVSLVVDDDIAGRNIPEPRRMSARLKAKKEDMEIDSCADKKSSINTHIKRRRTSSLEPREQPAAKKIRTSSKASKSTMRQISRLAKSRLVTVIEGEEHHLVHPEFRLQRPSFNGKNLTFGIPRHDKKDIDDVLRNAPYATDMFQYLYAAEVSVMESNF